MQQVLDKISNAPDSDLPAILYGYDQSSPGVREVLLGMLKPLRTPSSAQHMSVKATKQSGRFTMIVAQVPWLPGRQGSGLQPIIVTGESGHEQVVGYVLPFDDIYPLLKGSDMRDISALTQWWIQDFARSGGAGS